MAPVAVRLLDAQRIHGVHADEPEPGFIALGGDRVEHAAGKLGGDVELPSQLADVGDARRAHPRVTELDLLQKRRKGKIRSREQPR